MLRLESTLILYTREPPLRPRQSTNDTGSVTAREPLLRPWQSPTRSQVAIATASPRGGASAQKDGPRHDDPDSVIPARVAPRAMVHSQRVHGRPCGQSEDRATRPEAGAKD